MTAAHHVTNAEFLQVCFGQDWQAAHVTGFDGDPGAPPPGAWTGNRWGLYHKPEQMAEQNAYFTISTFGDDPQTGKVRRVIDLHRATHVIVIDDVGTKVPEDRIPAGLEPTYKLETSENNFQWGYVLETPCTDPAQVNALLSGMVRCLTGGTDPGMKGITRIVRLPEGINGKPVYQDKDGKPFRCRLGLWEPGRKTKIEDLAAGFGVALPAPGTRAVNPQRNSRTPSPAECAADEIYGLLDQWGMLTGGVTNDGGFKTVCPWTAEHTAAKDEGEGAYYLRGKYKCHHGHCESRSWRAMWEWANEKALDESGGLVGLTDKEGLWDLPLVPGYQEPGRRQPALIPPPGQSTGTGQGTGTGTGQAAARARFTEDGFFRENIFIRAEGKWHSTVSGELVNETSLNMTWTRHLADLLPEARGRRISPSEWFKLEDNKARAKEADRFTYWPGEAPFFHDANGVGLVNLWKAPERLGLPVTDAEVAPWLELVHHIVDGEGVDVTERVLDWLALVVAVPGLKPGWHLLLQGGQGVGKDLMLQPLIAGVGVDNVGKVNAKVLNEPFNPWAERRLVIANELHQTSKGSTTGKDIYAVLKELTENTNDWLRINRKFKNEYHARNVMALAVTSNDDQALALEADDRRFLVVMTTATPWDEDKYRRLRHWMNQRGGKELCVEWLWDRWERMPQDRRDKLEGRAPMTAGKSGMIRNTEDPLQTWFREMIETKVFPDLMTSQDIKDAIAAAARAGADGFSGVTPRRWAKVLTALGGAKVYRGAQVRVKNKGHVYMWATREPGRFTQMSEAALAQAYAGGTGHGFTDVSDGGADVISLAERKDTTSET